MQNPETRNISVIWRDKKFNLGVDPTATLKSLGDELLNLTNVSDDTVRLIVPTNKGSKLLYPFSEEHSCIKLEATSILEGKSIRMMGVAKDEVDGILQSAKADLRIIGFDEEEKRLKQRISNGLQTSIKLPQGPYVFCDFRALQLPGVELNPPASKALRLMHKLAADPGIVAIMNKHRWRVGIMTEMAPEGYVGISPKCLLGFNKNHGEEISLRLRTDDLKGFRKYDSIKKTLLHELAHMVHSEHDMKFHALDRQLNEEAATLDWTKSRSHTLHGLQHYEEDEDEDFDNHIESSHKLGGRTRGLFDARASSVVAAYSRLAQAASASLSEASEVHPKSNVDDSVEPDPDDYDDGSSMEHEPYTEHSSDNRTSFEPDPDDWSAKKDNIGSPTFLEPDPDEEATRIEKKERAGQNDYVSSGHNVNKEENGALMHANQVNFLEGVEPVETYTNDNDVIPDGVSSAVIYEPDPDDEELQRIQDPVTIISSRLQKAIGVLRSQAGPLEASRVVQTILKIIRNVIEHPDEVKFKKLRKANPLIQRDVVRHAAAVEILSVIGFSEDQIVDDTGRAEAYLILKRNDPGLLWLAKSSLETSIA